jgi:hypothetical protein
MLTLDVRDRISRGQAENANSKPRPTESPSTQARFESDFEIRIVIF